MNNPPQKGAVCEVCQGQATHKAMDESGEVHFVTCGEHVSTATNCGFSVLPMGQRKPYSHIVRRKKGEAMK